MGTGPARGGPAFPLGPGHGLWPRLRPWRCRQRRALVHAHGPACGPGGGHHRADGGVEASALTQFAACVRKHGIVNFPDPPWPNGELNKLGFTKQVLGKYENGACYKYFLAAGGVPTPAENQRRMEQMLRTARCIRAHGIVNFPDPSSQGAISMPQVVADEPLRGRRQGVRRASRPAGWAPIMS